MKAKRSGLTKCSMVFFLILGGMTAPSYGAPHSSGSHGGGHSGSHGGGHSGSHGGYSGSGHSSGSAAPVHVSGYTRKDGTVVQAYERARPGQGHSSGGDSGSAHSAPVHVSGYTRKDGTVVQPYDRAKPGQGSASSGGVPVIGSASSRTPRVYAHFASGGIGVRDDHGRIQRNEAAKREFMRDTGYPHGRPGYVVDHVVALKRGGADSPKNMQWQTIEAAKQKDKVE